jgi:hypothetical protein
VAQPNNDALDENTGRVDVVGVEFADLTISSTSATVVTLPAVAIIGLKLRAVLR